MCRRISGGLVAGLFTAVSVMAQTPWTDPYPAVNADHNIVEVLYPTGPAVVEWTDPLNWDSQQVPGGAGVTLSMDALTQVLTTSGPAGRSLLVLDSDVTIGGLWYRSNVDTNQGITGTGTITFDSGSAAPAFVAMQRVGVRPSSLRHAIAVNMHLASDLHLRMAVHRDTAIDTGLHGGQIGGDISGPGHLTLDLANNTHDSARFHLAGSANTYSGGTLVLADAMNEFAGASDYVVLHARHPGAFGTGDVHLGRAGGLERPLTLYLDAGQVMAAAAALHVNDSARTTIVLADGTATTLAALFIDGVEQAEGAWGAPGNPAAQYTHALFSGGGILTVAAPSGDPGDPGPGGPEIIEDLDGDGMCDVWELAHGLDPADPSDAQDSLSGDGMTNLEKFLLALDPQTPTWLDGGAPGRLLSEEWRDVAGERLRDLYAFSGFPAQPVLRHYPAHTALSGTHSAGGRRVRATLTAPAAGQYRFRIAASGEAELWLGHDAAPFVLDRVASVPQGVGENTYPFVSQVSRAVELAAGTPLFIEILHKHPGGDDHLRVEWSFHGGHWETLGGECVHSHARDAGDQDDDGLRDTWELVFGFDPADPRDAWADADGDGLLNREEFLLGLDPYTQSWLADGVPGGLLEEIWRDVPGRLLSHLHASEDYPSAPDERRYSAQTEPGRLGDNAGRRLRGMLVPPASGVYRFRISSSHESELWLGRNEWPFDVERIGHVPTWTTYNTFGSYLSQYSRNIVLEAGRPYYVEILQKRGEDGDDHLSVQWSRDGGDWAPIGPAHLHSYVQPAAWEPEGWHSLLGERTDLALHAGADTTARTGEWLDLDGVLHALGIRGELTYTLAVPASGIYAVEVEGRASSTLATDKRRYEIEVLAGGTPLGRGSFMASHSDAGRALFFLPWQPGAGDVEVTVRWLNIDPRRHLAVVAVRLVDFAGEEWQQARRAEASGLEDVPAASHVSPAFIEGRARFLDRLTVEVGAEVPQHPSGKVHDILHRVRERVATHVPERLRDQVPVGPRRHLEGWIDGKHRSSILPLRGTGTGWYADIPLSPADTTTVTVEDAESGFTWTGGITWQAWDLSQAAPAGEYLVRAGSAMRFTAPEELTLLVNGAEQDFSAATMYDENVPDGLYRYRVRKITEQGPEAWFTGLEDCVVVVSERDELVVDAYWGSDLVGSNTPLAGAQSGSTGDFNGDGTQDYRRTRAFDEVTPLSPPLSMAGKSTRFFGGAQATYHGSVTERLFGRFMIRNVAGDPLQVANNTLHAGGSSLHGTVVWLAEDFLGVDEGEQAVFHAAGNAMHLSVATEPGSMTPEFRFVVKTGGQYYVSARWPIPARHTGPPSTPPWTWPSTRPRPSSPRWSSTLSRRRATISRSTTCPRPSTSAARGSRSARRLWPPSPPTRAEARRTIPPSPPRAATRCAGRRWRGPRATSWNDPRTRGRPGT